MRTSILNEQAGSKPKASALKRKPQALNPHFRSRPGPNTENQNYTRTPLTQALLFYSPPLLGQKPHAFLGHACLSDGKLMRQLGLNPRETLHTTSTKRCTQPNTSLLQLNTKVNTNSNYNIPANGSLKEQTMLQPPPL